MSQTQYGFLLLATLPGFLAQAPLRGQAPVRGQVRVSARIVGPEELPTLGRIQTLQDLDFGSIRCSGQEGVVTLAAGGTRSTRGGVPLGADSARSGATLAFQGPPAQGFNFQLQNGPILARNGRGDLVQVGGCSLQVQGNLLALGASARIMAGQPAGHYAGDCFLNVLFH